MGMTLAEVLGIIITVGGGIATTALFILNLKVGWAMQAMKAEMARDLGKIELQVANLRTESAITAGGLYERIMENLSKVYATRDAQEAMHKANTARLDAIEEDMRQLTTKVGDIG